MRPTTPRTIRGTRRIGRVPTRLVCLLALVAGALAACSSGAPQTLQGIERTPAIEVAGAALPDATTGEPFELRGAPGGLLVVYFGYTSCPDICPTTMSDLQVAIGDLDAARAARVQVAMATVDPERDSRDLLRQYIAHFFSDGHALRTDDPTVQVSVQQTFGVAVEIAPHQPGEDYEVGHTAVAYVVDDTGRVAVEWPFGMKPDAMTADLKLLLATDVDRAAA